MHQYQALRKQTLTQPVGRDKSSRSGQRSAREMLLLCTTANISPEGMERLSQILAGAIDWEYWLDLVERHGVMPLMAHNLVANGLSSQVPQPCLERLNQAYNNTLFRNAILSAELSKVLSTFSRRGIPVIPLKGTVLAELLYGNLALRTMEDVDILVQPEELQRASAALVEMGYIHLNSPSTSDHPFHGAPYFKQTVFRLNLELHWDLDDQELVSVPKQEIWRRARPLQLQGDSIMMLSPEDTLLFLANHLLKHDSHLLKLLGDVAQLLKKYDGVLDWDKIIGSAHSWQIEAPVYYSLKRARDLLGAPVPESAVRALKPGAWRCWVLDFLASQESFVSPIRRDKLRIKTSVLVRSLMMKHIRQMLAVLTRYRTSEGWGAWLKTAMTIALVFGAALGRNMVRVISAWQWTGGRSPQ